MYSAGSRRRRLTRQERAPQAREAIFAAAMAVVGEHGYANASVSRIAEAAGIAQGTFYLYFASRQALFNELLPYFGQQMLAFIRARIGAASNVLEKEERGFRAFFEYMRENPAFFRVLAEANSSAPLAYTEHFELVTRPYVETLRRGLERREISGFGVDELETLAYMLMSMREYIYILHERNEDGTSPSLEMMTDTYMKFVRNALVRTRSDMA